MMNADPLSMSSGMVTAGMAGQGRVCMGDR